MVNVKVDKVLVDVFIVEKVVIENFKGNAIIRVPKNPNDPKVWPNLIYLNIKTIDIKMREVVGESMVLFLDNFVLIEVYKNFQKRKDTSILNRINFIRIRVLFVYSIVQVAVIKVINRDIIIIKIVKMEKNIVVDSIFFAKIENMILNPNFWGENDFKVVKNFLIIKNVHPIKANLNIAIFDESIHRKKIYHFKFKKIDRRQQKYYNEYLFDLWRNSKSSGKSFLTTL